jgi:hypothetical protein
MTPIHDHEAESLQGGALLRLNVSPTINVGTTVVPQVNGGAAVGVGNATVNNTQSNFSRVRSALGGIL